MATRESNDNRTLQFKRLRLEDCHDIASLYGESRSSQRALRRWDRLLLAVSQLACEWAARREWWSVPSVAAVREEQEQKNRKMLDGGVK